MLQKSDGDTSLKLPVTGGGIPCECFSAFTAHLFLSWGVQHVSAWQWDLLLPSPQAITQQGWCGRGLEKVLFSGHIGIFLLAYYSVILLGEYLKIGLYL